MQAPSCYTSPSQPHWGAPELQIQRCSPLIPLMQPHHTAHISHKIERLCTLNVLKIDTSIIAQERASLLQRTKLLKSCSMWQICVYKALIKSRCTFCEITQNRQKLFFFSLSLSFFFFLSRTHDSQIMVGLKTQAFVPPYYFFRG